MLDDVEELERPWTLHALLEVGAVWVWGARPSAEAPWPRGRMRSGVARDLSLAVEVEALRGALGEGGAVASSEAATVWLPTVGNRAVVAHGEVSPGPQDELRWQSWRVPALRLDASSSLAWLREIEGRQMAAAGVRLGEGVRALAHGAAVARLAFAAGRFLPGLRIDADGVGFGQWRAAGDALAEGLDGWDRRAPASVFAGRHEGAGADAEGPAPVDRRQILAAMLDGWVDALVRERAPSVGGRAAKATDATLHERWVASLKGPTPELSASPAEIAALERSLDTWSGYLLRALRLPYRPVVRVEEPEDPERDETWHVELFLRHRVHPERRLTLVEAASQPHLHRFALDVLGQLGRLAGSAKPAFDEAASPEAERPGAAALTTSEAFALLSDVVPRLEEAGLAVEVPKWWTRRGATQRLRAKAVVGPEFDASAGLSLDEVLRFRWQVTLGGEVLDEARLRELAASKRPLIRLAERWVEVSQEEARRAIALLRQGEEEASAGELVRASLGVDTLGAELELDVVEASGALGELLERLEAKERVEALGAPEGFEGALRPYQALGHGWMTFLTTHGLGACLADDMGLGKTVQALAMLQTRWGREGAQPSLLICPTSVLTNWRREAQRFTPELAVEVHHGAGRVGAEGFAAWARDKALVLTSYGTMLRDREALGGVEWRTVLLDEAQAIKNPRTRTAKTVFGLPAQSRVALTGTPVENHVGDLWSLMRFLNPGLLGSAEGFRQEFYRPIQLSGDEAAVEALRRRVAPFLLRRVKSDPAVISDLPEKVELRDYCRLTREQASLYRATTEAFLEELEAADPERRWGMVLAVLTRLKQICDHPALYLGERWKAPAGEEASGKLARLDELFTTIFEAGEAALIFTQYRAMGTRLAAWVEQRWGREALFLHGGVSQPARQAMVDRFQAPDGPSVFVVSLKAGGTGLNLTRANHVVHYDRWWNPAVEDQATDRAFRIGQTRNVFVHKLISEGTLEEKIDAIISRKAELAERIVGGEGEAWLTQLDDEALRSILTLDDDALDEVA